MDNDTIFDQNDNEELNTDNFISQELLEAFECRKNKKHWIYQLGMCSFLGRKGLIPQHILDRRAWNKWFVAQLMMKY